MRLLFITNKFPPVSCGVGDYTFKLALALIDKGCHVSVLCASKPEIKENKEIFEKENLTVYPIVESWNSAGLNKVRGILDTDQFDVVSLQFVPFSFQKKGLPIGLAKSIKQLFNKCDYHIMFHELWVGMEANASLRSKMHGVVQREIIRNIIKILKPVNISTNTKLYKDQIKNLGFEAELLPLFSNIIKQKSIEIDSTNNELTFALFGNIHFGAPIEEFILELISCLHTIGKTINDVNFLFLGRCGNNIDNWVDVLNSHNIKYKITGKLSESEISRCLSNSNYGLTTTPYILVEKSGTVASMLQHNLKVLCVSRTWDVNNYDSTNFSINNPIFQYKENNLIDFFRADIKFTYQNVEEVSQTFLNLLN